MVLNILRSKKFSKRILTILLIIIIPAFVLWGVGSLKNRPGLIGIINSKKIYADDFMSSRQGIRVQMILAYYMDSETLRQLMNNRQLMDLMAWERLILLNAAEKQKIKISDDTVRAFLIQHPLFSRSGQFDPRAYEQITRQAFSLEPRQFEELLRENLKIRTLRQGILKGIEVSDNEMRERFQSLNGKVDLSYILVNKDNFIDDAIVSEEAAMDEYNKNMESFYSPGKITIEYIEMPFNGKGEKENIFLMLNTLYPELKNSPEQFSEIAKTNNLKYGKTPSFSREDVIPDIPFFEDFHNTAFSLKTGEVSAPVILNRDKGAVYILRKTSEMPPEKLSFEDVKADILSSMKTSKAFSLAEEEALKIYLDITEKGTPFETAALKTPDGLKTAPAVSADGYIDNVGPANDIIMFSMEQGEGAVISPVIVPNGAVIPRVDLIHPLDEKEFNNKKENIKQQLISQKQAQVLENWFEENSKNTELKKDLNEI